MKTVGKIRFLSSFNLSISIGKNFMTFVVVLNLSMQPSDPFIARGTPALLSHENVI